jgi:hypothetical protein
MSFSIKLNRVTTCDCCGQDKPVRAWKHSFEQANQFDVVFNDDKDYVELVDRCPNCGYVKYIMFRRLFYGRIRSVDKFISYR